MKNEKIRDDAYNILSKHFSEFTRHHLRAESIIDAMIKFHEQQVKILNIPDVVGRSELLTDFLIWYNGKFQKETTATRIVEEYWKYKGG